MPLMIQRTTLRLWSMSSMPCPGLPETHGGKTFGSPWSPLQGAESVSPVLRCSPGEGSQIKERSAESSSAPSPIRRSSPSTYPAALGTIPPSGEVKRLPPISEEIRRSEKRLIMGHRFSKNTTIKGAAQSESFQDSLPCVCKTHRSMVSTLWPTTVLLIALTATKTSQIDKVRFVKKLLPNL